MAEPEARGELWASKTSCNKILCKAASLWVIDMSEAADFVLAHFLMTVCDGCASEVGSKVWQLLLQLSQLQQQPLHKIARQPLHTCSILL